MPARSLNWQNASSNYPIFTNHHHLPETRRDSASIPLRSGQVVFFAATAHHKPFHSSVEAVFGHSSCPAWYSSFDQN